MMKMLRSRYAGLIECVIVFLIAAIAYSIIMFSVQWFAAVDDVYIHTIRAASYIWDVDVPFPVTTVFVREGAGFYQLYYMLHVPFFALASLIMRGGLFLGQLPPVEVLFFGAKLFHVTVISIFYVTVFWITQKMFGRNAALLSLLLLFTASDIFQGRFLIMRPHTLASLLFLVFVTALVWRKYVVIFAIAVATVLSYTVSFMLLVPAVLVSLIDRKATVVAVTLGGLIIGIVLQPLGIAYVQYAWMAHILSAALTAFDLHPASPGEFNTVDTVGINGTWLLVIFMSIVLCLLRPKAVQDFLQDRRATELIVITILFIPLMMLSPRGSEYFIPVFCVIAAGFLVHMFGAPGGKHAEGGDREIRLFAKVFVVVSGVFATVIFFGSFQFYRFSVDPRPSFSAAQCIGEGRAYSRDFGTYVFFPIANPKLHFLAGIDPIFTIVDPVYGKYSSALFGAKDKTVDELLPTLRELKTDYIVTDVYAFGWKGGLFTLIKDPRLEPVCARSGSSHTFFRILP